ncbi:MAG TPA: NAD(P)/FAD-dependent oxidoreductase [Terriglobales bacterium]
MKADLIVVGGGAAGITAAIRLAKSGLRVRLLEARSRLGGRMLTAQESSADGAVELGAEFIHGRPSEIFDILKAHKISVKAVEGESLRLEGGQLQSTNFFSEVDQLMEKMNDQGPDESFAQFLERCCPERNQEKVKQWARGYVTGFHAADPELISVHSLVKGMRAEEEIGGHQSFRMKGGYATLLQIWEKQLKEAGVHVQLGAKVKSIRWKKGDVELEMDRNGENVKYTVPKVLLTLPLSLLQTGTVNFVPELSSKQSALDKLVMGKVIRVTLCFRERFWDDLHAGKSGKTLSNASFLFSGEDWFPTWWTTMPEKLPVITGWAPFHCAEQLTGKNADFIVARATETLAKILKVDLKEINRLLASAHFHDWEADPLSGGAYSYVKAGGDSAQKGLSAPIDDTLFFAGEATDFTGHHGTVHGAIRSGNRAAEEILKVDG